MKLALSLVVATFLVNIWINYSVLVDSGWPNSVPARLIVLATMATIILLVAYYRRDKAAGRAAFYVAAVTLVAVCINAVPFVMYGEGLTFEPSSQPSNGTVVSALRSPQSILSILQSQADIRRASATDKARYETAINLCVQQKMRGLHYTENASRFECVSSASIMGRTAFVDRYVPRNPKRVGPT